MSEVPSELLYTSEHEWVRRTGDDTVRLRERHYGSFQALTYDEARQRFPQDYAHFEKRTPDYVFPGGGESLRQFSARIHAVLHDIAESHRGDIVLVVTHGGVLDIAHRLRGAQVVRVVGQPLLGALGSGRTLRLLLLELGVAGPEIDAVEAAIRPSAAASESAARPRGEASAAVNPVAADAAPEVTAAEPKAPRKRPAAAVEPGAAESAESALTGKRRVRKSA